MNDTLLPEELRALLPESLHGQCSGILCRKGERLFFAGDRPEWMFYVVRGEVTLERTGQQGEPVVLQRTRRGFVSEASLRVDAYHCDALAIADTAALRLPVRELARALDQDPAFAGRWIRMLNTEVRRLRLHCERLSMKSVRERLLHLIQTEGDNGRYALPSGLKTLAGELAVTHEALYRTLATLEREGLIERREGGLSLRANG